MLTKEQILNSTDMPIEIVAVPEWDGEVGVRTISAKERDQWEQSLMKGRGKSRQMDMNNIRARLAALCMCDADGNRLFADDDVFALGAKSAAAMERVFIAAARLNGITDKDVEELAKNSVETEDGDSNSD